MLVSGVIVLFQLGDETHLELVTHKEVEMGRLVEEIPVRLHTANLLKRK